MSERTLLAVLNGRAVATVTMDRHGRLSLAYDPAWRAFDGAFPLSLSLPLAREKHSHRPVTTFLEGLLPDRDEILDAWARRFQSSRHPFSLLSHVGEDCPGAFQFLSPERFSGLGTDGAPQVEWLTEAQIGERIRALRADPAAWRSPGDAGQFSLGGAQAKTSLLWHEGRWGVPYGRTPTTHILKPSIPGFDGHVVNEHLCLELARALGLPVASSEVRRFGEETVIVVERYDRSRTSATTPILRLHQEDMCQALAVPPRLKYQSEGGPGVREIGSLLRNYSSRPEDDVWTFLDALAFNWLIGGTDAHAKNYSILHGDGSRVRLAPFYDLASVLVYEGFSAAKLKLSMKLGGTYALQQIDREAWARVAAELALRPDPLLNRVRAMADALPGEMGGVVSAARASGLDHPIVDQLSTVLSERSRYGRRLLD